MFLAFMGAMAVEAFIVLTAPSTDPPVRTAVLILGYVAEVVGLGMAMRGLYMTWSANAPGRPLWPAWARLRARFRRGRHIRIEVSDGAGSSDSGLVTFSGQATGLAPPLTTEERVAQLGKEFERLRSDLGGVQAAVGREGRRREQDIAVLRADMTDRDDQVRALAVRLAVDGIPLAISGLLLTVIGLVLQALSQGAPS